jgi:LacI family transcriptional regulator
MRGRVTLTQVAERAGVSVATVSKVINGRAGIGEATRRDVEKIVDELGYVGVSERERPIRRTRDPLVQVISASFVAPYTLMFLSGAAAAAETKQAALVACSLSTVEKEDPMKWAERVARSGRVGVIEVTSSFSKRREAALRAAGLPAVFVDPLDVPRIAVHSVGATNWMGGYEATRHLASLGHVRIAFLGSRRAACDVIRRRGYAAALQEFGLADDHPLLLDGPNTFEGGVRAATALLLGPLAPTAIFTSSDLTALGALEAARRLNISVPQELSVVGFDDTLLAEMSVPPLTTVYQPVREIGQAAVTMVMNLAAGYLPPTRRIELPTHLVVRGSTAAAP